MRIVRLMSEIQFNNEEHKQLFQRREMGGAYKRDAKYRQANKEEMLKILENLLSNDDDSELITSSKTTTVEEKQSIKSSAKEHALQVGSVSKDVKIHRSERTFFNYNRAVCSSVYEKAVSEYTCQMEIAAKGFIMNQPNFLRFV